MAAHRRIVGTKEAGMKGLFLDASEELAGVFRAMSRDGDPPIDVNIQAQVAPGELPAMLAGYDIALNDHTFMPTDAMRGCTGLRHVIFLGTGARSYMDPEELATLGIVVHTIKGYGDTAVAEHAIALMWAAARGIARMDGGMRAGRWLRTEGMQLTGKTIGLVGYGGIGAEVARIARGSGMRVLAWNRTPRIANGVEFVPLDRLLAQSHIVSLHLLLNDETRGFLDSARLSAMRPGAILINTARGALVNTPALVEALRSDRIGHAALDVFDHEPLPPGDVLTTLENVTLSAHSAFRTPEASETLIRRAQDIACEIARG
jgi:D-3-phosphoglycerate dehydrogenase / 2-oxoglutarate reductase